MSLLYADTSALIRAYFSDEEDHSLLRRLLLEGAEPVVSSELARLEFVSAASAASRNGRLRQRQIVLDRFDADCGDGGPLALLRLRPEAIFELAHRLLQRHLVRTLDAIHLAVATSDAAELAGSEAVILVTRDRAQAAAARAMGLATA